MKKGLYWLLLLAEAAAGYLGVRVLWAYLGTPFCVAVLAIWAVLMAWQLILLAKATDPARKKAIRRAIALVMLVPFSGCIIGPVMGVVSFALAFV